MLLNKLLRQNQFGHLLRSQTLANIHVVHEGSMPIEIVFGAVHSQHQLVLGIVR